MGKVLAIVFEENKVHTYDGVDYSTYSIPKTLLTINSHYAQVHAWVISTVATMTTGVSTIVLDTGHYDATLSLTDVADFNEFFEFSGLNIITMIRAAINDYVKANKATVKGFTLPYMSMRHHCSVCNALNPPPTLRQVGGYSPVSRMDTCGHEIPSKRQIPYALLKHLTTPLPD